jgi:acetylornithine deacetylase/succinyl-diaminopimelate desuccinylase-like protein
MRIRSFALAPAFALALAAAPLTAHGQDLPPDVAAFRALYQELIETNTTLSAGDCTLAANRMAAHLKAAGLPDKDITLIAPDQDKRFGNLVAVLPGTDPKAKAVLMLAHLDVVEAKAEDWGRDPFKLEEKDGFFIARGATDDKAMAAIFVDAMMRFKQEQYRPRRTIKLALTCGEETPNTFNGAEYLVKTHRTLIDAQLALNEGGSGLMSADGTRVFNGVQAGEKVYQDFTLEVTNPGGHSSRPQKANAIYQLATALKKIEAYEFPIEFNAATRGYFEKMAAIRGGAVGADMKAILAKTPDPAALARLKEDPGLNSILHTTCVATMLNAGHAPNALPQRATANVNCRIFPGHRQDEIKAQLEAVIGDPAVRVSFTDPPETFSPPPKLTPAVMGPIEKLTAGMWPGVPVVPLMASGATDGRFLTPAGIPTYGVSGIFADPNNTRAHGLNETVPVQSLYQGRDFLYRLVKAYAEAK